MLPKKPVQVIYTQETCPCKQCPSYPHRKSVQAASKVTPTRNLCEQRPSYPTCSTRNLSKQCPSYSHKKPVQTVSKLLTQETCLSKCRSYSHKKPVQAVSHKKPVQVTRTRNLMSILKPVSKSYKHVVIESISRLSSVWTRYSIALCPLESFTHN